VPAIRHTVAVQLVQGVVQHYAWGDPTFIPRLLDIEPDGRPYAELWFGTHPGGPAMVDGDQSLRSLTGELPYLLKLLAAADPLSLQTHPTRQQAEAGFAREEQNGPQVDGATRLYRDPRPKPELLCALTQFDALCGFRPVDATVALLRSLGADPLADHLQDHGLIATVEALYERQLDLAPIVEVCHERDEPEARLVDDLAGQYRGDPSVAVTLLLNRVMLEPGEAIFLGPGNLHAYLRGAGVEIMGASDNVIRGGMTPKHVDVGELMAVLKIEPLAEPRTIPVEIEPGRWCYDTPDTPFRLWRWELDGTIDHRATGREMLLCTAGSTTTLRPGEVAYLAPYEQIHLDGTGTVFRVEERPTV
jgi:mannose-6-phosphate isomerase